MPGCSRIEAALGWGCHVGRSKAPTSGFSLPRTGVAVSAQEAKTESTTSSEPDPHKGKIIFDCPWCGAVTLVPEAFLGDHYQCPECMKMTKLTGVNTRHGHITDPPPGAPEAEASHVGRVIAGVVVLLIAGAIAVGLSMGGDDKAPDDTPVATTPSKTPAPGPAPGPEPAPTPEPTGTKPEPVQPKPEAAKVTPEMRQAKERLDAATQVLTVARMALMDAENGLRAWQEANAEQARALEEMLALVEVDAHVKSRLSGIDTLYASREFAEEFRESTRTFVAADPKRVKGVEALMEVLLADPNPRTRPRISTWREVDFFLPGVRVALGDRVGGLREALMPAVGEHLRRIETAQASVANAEKTHAEAIKALQTLEGG